MSDMTQVEYSHEDDIICPYCGHAEMDSWEFGDSSGPHECSACGVTCYVVTDVSVTYSSRPMPSAVAGPPVVKEIRTTEIDNPPMKAGTKEGA